MSALAPLVVGRYALYDKVAAGGMATVYIGRLAGPVGFSKTVAIKRLHPQFATDPDFVAMFLDEARLAARIQHPNVVSTLDVVATNGELFLVMEYVRGESVSTLLRRLNAAGERIPERISAAIASGTLQGLHAAHTATDEGGRPLGIVHRDVSPQNVLVGIDGTPRVLDFGVAKAEDKIHSTRGGEIKGKLMYMPPEQLEGELVDATADVYALGLLLFEMLTGRRMFQKENGHEGAVLAMIMRNEITLPSAVDLRLARWDPVVRRATEKDPSKRYPTARHMAQEVERTVGVASSVEVGDFVQRLAGEVLKERSKRIAEIESSSSPIRSRGPAALALELARSDDPTIPAVPPSGDAGVEVRSERSGASRVAHMISLPPAPNTSRRRGVVLVAGGVALVGAVAIFVFARRGDSYVHAASQASPPPAETAVSTSSPVAAPPPDSVSGSPAAPPPTGAGAPGAPIVASLPLQSSPVVRPPPPGRPVAAPAAAPGKPVGKPKCDPPYTVDSAGHMHFRPECL
jgi:eukaryotic-like serine/threonine-protein kinase